MDKSFILAYLNILISKLLSTKMNKIEMRKMHNSIQGAPPNASSMLTIREIFESLSLVLGLLAGYF